MAQKSPDDPPPGVADHFNRLLDQMYWWEWLLSGFVPLVGIAVGANFAFGFIGQFLSDGWLKLGKLAVICVAIVAWFAVAHWAAQELINRSGRRPKK